MVDPGLAPKPGEFVQRGGADKFIGSDLEQRLKDKGIKTVIVTGTSAQGAVVGTSNGAVQRGYNAVVPVDGMSAEEPYNEQYAAWHLSKGGPGGADRPRHAHPQRPHQVRRVRPAPNPAPGPY